MNETSKAGLLTWSQIALYAIGAITCFHLAYTFQFCAPLIALFFFALFHLRNVSSSRKAFYLGLVMGFAIYAPQLSFFWTLFDKGAIALWLILSFWFALFLLLLRLISKRMASLWMPLTAALLWTGLEYFRSELYYLRFSWMNAGYLFSSTKFASIFGLLGMYGIGFFIATIAFVAGTVHWKRGLVIIIIFAGLLLGLLAPVSKTDLHSDKDLQVAGIQMEFPNENEVVPALDHVLKEFPKTQLFVLSENTFHTEVSKGTREWCKQNRKFLIAGGRTPVSSDTFYNTAFVVGDNGEILHQQVKSVPVQFMKDGLPAKEQKVWDSPWGKIGICICYDFSYRRVVDELIRQGAQAIVVPTMDVIAWGEYQHQLHARVAPVRAAEFGIPIFRVCSSGISQLVERGGFISATAPFPGEGKHLAGTLRLSKPGQLPIDHWLGPTAVGITGLVILRLAWAAFSERRQKKS